MPVALEETDENKMLKSFFVKKIENNKDQVQSAIIAMETLLEAIKIDKSSTTIMELIDRLGSVRKLLADIDIVPQKASIKSGSELFLRFTTMMISDIMHQSSDFDKVKEALIDRGIQCISTMKLCREKAVRHFQIFVPESARVLIHGYSRAVADAIRLAAANGRLKCVYQTKLSTATTDDEERGKFLKELKEAGIECYEVLSESVAYLMERIDVVILGAEAVVESGSVISSIGSYGVAITADVHKKPVYVICESFKFMRSYPMKQLEVEQDHKYTDGDSGHPIGDLTPAKFVTLLITDLGALTPAAVGHHLIQLYSG